MKNLKKYLIRTFVVTIIVGVCSAFQSDKTQEETKYYVVTAVEYPSPTDKVSQVIFNVFEWSEDRYPYTYSMQDFYQKNYASQRGTKELRSIMLHAAYSSKDVAVKKRNNLIRDWNIALQINNYTPYIKD